MKFALFLLFEAVEFMYVNIDRQYYTKDNIQSATSVTLGYCGERNANSLWYRLGTLATTCEFLAMYCTIKYAQVVVDILQQTCCKQANDISGKGGGVDNPQFNVFKLL